MRLSRSVLAIAETSRMNQICSRRLGTSTKSWKVQDSLNNPETISLSQKLKCHTTKMPIISQPSDVLVKVHASSVNPLDLRMAYGYGRRVLDLLDWATNFEPRITNDRYPLTLGRDFSGEVIATGPHAECKVGDLVFGVIEPHKSGAHGQYIIASSNCLTKKPDNLSHLEAASIPFSALTAYSALSTFGGLSRRNCSGKQALVIGGSGGVGSISVQLLRLWGANVTATCSEDKIEWLETNLFVDKAVNHNDSSQLTPLSGQFDFVLDCGNYEKTSLTHENIVDNSLRYLKPFGHGVYVTLSPPFLNNTDREGIVAGSAKSAFEAALDTFKSVRSLNSARWAFFIPNKSALEYVAGLLKEESLFPKVSSIHDFAQVPQAFEELRNGNQVKGKVVIDVLRDENCEGQATSN